MTTHQPLRLRARSTAALVLVTAVGVVAFGWPLLAQPESGVAHSTDAPWLFALLLPLLLVIVLASVVDRSMDATTVAMLGVLCAVGTGLRILGTGAGGVEPVFVLFVLVGRVFGPGFGFVLGQLTILTSALVTGGVGPWLPFQMLAAGWISMGAGMLPEVRGRVEVWMLAGYGALAGLTYGFLINLWFWPFTTYADTGLSFQPGASLGVNLTHYAAFFVTTSLAWDIVRATLTAGLCVVAGRPLLGAFRRVARRAFFAEPVQRSA